MLMKQRGNLDLRRKRERKGINARVPGAGGGFLLNAPSLGGGVTGRAGPRWQWPRRGEDLPFYICPM